MSLTKLDSNAALIVIDLQKGLSGSRPFTLPAKSLIARPSWRVLSGSEACRSFLST
jgi:hypothetical protein